MGMCRDCAENGTETHVEPLSGSSIGSSVRSKAKPDEDVCVHGFTNTGWDGIPASEGGYGYFLCCNCSLKDGWGQDNYQSFACKNCRKNKSRRPAANSALAASA